MSDKKIKPNSLWSMLTMRCPRCRKGHMYKDANPYTSLKFAHIFNMYEYCPVCKQKFDLEPGFWFGTAYVSYALTVAVSASTFVAWVIFIGISTDDNRVFFWLGFNCIFLVLIQPWLMRLSRALYIRFFIRYDPDYAEREKEKMNA